MQLMTLLDMVFGVTGVVFCVAGAALGTGAKNPPTSAFHDYDLPIIWVGGVARSGTTLMRSLLDVHPSIRCGPETRTLIHMSSAYNRAVESAAGLAALARANQTAAAVRHATSAFFLSVILHHGDTTTKYCNKDPFLLGNMERILRMFRRSKFIFMVRDTRAGVNSLVENNVNTGTAFNLSDHAQCMQAWQEKFMPMYEGCKTLGPNRCLPVYYETLVANTNRVLPGIIDFLEAEWTDSLLHHEEVLGSNNALVFPTYLASRNQVTHGIYTSSMMEWQKHVPADVQERAVELAPVLVRLGYVIDADGDDGVGLGQTDYDQLPILDFFETTAKTVWRG